MKRFIDDDQKFCTAVAPYKKKCRCGHSMLVSKRKGKEFDLCSWCGHRIYADDNKQKIYEEKLNKDNFFKQLQKYLMISNCIMKENSGTYE